MTKQEKPFKLSESEARNNIIDMLQSGRLEGIMTIAGQSGISVEASTVTYPLPDGDYLVVRIASRGKATPPKVGWVPAVETEPEPVVEDAE